MISATCHNSTSEREQFSLYASLLTRSGTFVGEDYGAHCGLLLYSLVSSTRPQHAPGRSSCSPVWIKPSCLSLDFDGRLPKTRRVDPLRRPPFELSGSSLLSLHFLNSSRIDCLSDRWSVLDLVPVIIFSLFFDAEGGVDVAEQPDLSARIPHRPRSPRESGGPILPL